MMVPKLSPALISESTETLVSLHVPTCERVAAVLARHVIPIDQEDTKLPELSRTEIGNFYLFLVAICHQTSPKGLPPLAGKVNGRSLRGWDYLSARLEGDSATDHSLLAPKEWGHMTGERLACLFRDSEAGDRLTEPGARALLIRNLGEVMERNAWKAAEDIYEKSGHRIAQGSANLLELLSRFRAYDDPVCKKSYFFLGVMRNAGLWSYVDNENLGAPVDYHEVRGHLRIGTVTVHDAGLREKLFRGEPVNAEEDIAIRRAVLEAILLLSRLTGLKNPSQLHYLFWNVFRSCCTRESPHCFRCPSRCTLPERYVPLAIHEDGVRRCPFSSVCQSAGREPKLLEHVFKTDYY
ncbi:MAG: hypothetical protein ABR964_07315 [Tepidisphaeraceae bacterium]|jgi:hypothetical protein